MVGRSKVGIFISQGLLTLSAVGISPFYIGGVPVTVQGSITVYTLKHWIWLVDPWSSDVALSRERGRAIWFVSRQTAFSRRAAGSFSSKSEKKANAIRA